MNFRRYDSLRVFTQVAQHNSFSAAAESLNLTKGAVSSQMRLLETALGFSLFDRQSRGVSLTREGRNLFAGCLVNFNQIDEIIAQLQEEDRPELTIGLTTYFASRWLSARLMGFMQQHPAVRLRLQPMVDVTDLEGEGVDLAIRWGNGQWKDSETQLLFVCPAWPCGNEHAVQQVMTHGVEESFNSFTLLHDRQDSQAWAHWFSAAGLSYRSRVDTLIIPDPNVRVEAVVNNQGVALADALVEREVNAGSLYRLSDVELVDYGYYLIYETNAKSRSIVAEFSRWIADVGTDSTG